MNLNKSTPSHWKGIDACKILTHTRTGEDTHVYAHTHPRLPHLCILESGYHLFDPPLLLFLFFFATYYFSHHLTHLWMLPHARLGRLIDCMCQCVCVCVFVIIVYIICPAVAPDSLPVSPPLLSLPLSLALSLSMCLCHSSGGTLRARRSGWST